MKFGSYMHRSKLTQVCSNQGCMTYFHWIMLMSFRVVYNMYIVYLQCITICHYVISHFLISSLEPMHGFASNFVWMFLGWTPTKFVKIGVLPLFFMELWVILCNFWPILKKSSSIKPLTRNHSYLVPKGSNF